MEITRNGKAIELTREELEQAYEEYKYRCEREDILSNLQYHLSDVECVVLARNEKFVKDAIKELRRLREQEFDYEFGEENAIKNIRQKYDIFKGLSSEELKGFIEVGRNREDAYKDYLCYESGFGTDASSTLSFERFCKELDKGYGNSGCVQVGRLLECTDGSILYDKYYV